MECFLAISIIVICFGVYTVLMIQNLNMLRENRQARLEARRKQRAERGPLWKKPPSS